MKTVHPTMKSFLLALCMATSHTTDRSHNQTSNEAAQAGTIYEHDEEMIPEPVLLYHRTFWNEEDPTLALTSNYQDNEETAINANSLIIERTNRSKRMRIQENEIETNTINPVDSGLSTEELDNLFANHFAKVHSSWAMLRQFEKDKSDNWPRVCRYFWRTMENVEDDSDVRCYSEPLSTNIRARASVTIVSEFIKCRVLTDLLRCACKFISNTINKYVPNVPTLFFIAPYSKTKYFILSQVKPRHLEIKYLYTNVTVPKFE